MEFNKDKIQDLINEWIILRNVSPNNKKYVQKQLDELDENYLDYIGYWNDISEGQVIFIPLFLIFLQSILLFSSHLLSQSILFLALLSYKF